MLQPRYSIRHARHALRDIFLVMLMFSLSMTATGCGLIDTIKDTLGWGQSITERELAVIDSAIVQLSNANADWQQILIDTRDKLTEAAMSGIRNEVTMLMQRTAEATGTQIRCLMDMSATRVRQGLVRIRNNILNQPNPPVEPYICTAVPNAVDMGLPAHLRNKIELGGFDVDSNPKLQMFLVNSNGTVDVSYALSQPTHYQLVVNLGANGVPLSSSSNMLLFKWQGNEEYSLPIIQPVTPVCQKQQPPGFTPSAITYMPPNTSGSDSDADFGGHGPEVTIAVDLARSNAGQSIHINLYMDAVETQSNWTHASGILYKEIYHVPSGWRIYSIDSPTHDELHYIDSNHEDDNFNGGGPVSIFTVTGDAPGNDAGYATKVNVTFNPIRVTLIQTGNCVSTAALMQNIESNQLSAETLQRLKPEIPVEEWKLLSRDHLTEIDPGLRELIPEP